MTHHVLHDVGGEDAKLRISDAYREDLVVIEGHYYARDEVAAALGLVTREDFGKAVALSEARQTELEEAQAIIERARELLPVTLRAALNRNPAFVLPTEIPATIEAKRIHFGWTSRLVLWTDGTERFWRAEYDGQDYTEVGVMDGMFTGHRLIGEA